MTEPRKRAPRAPKPVVEHDPYREPQPGDQVLSCVLPDCAWSYVMPPLTDLVSLSALMGVGPTLSSGQVKVDKDLEAHLKTHSVAEWAKALVAARDEAVVLAEDLEVLAREADMLMDTSLVLARIEAKLDEIAVRPSSAPQAGLDRAPAPDPDAGQARLRQRRPVVAPETPRYGENTPSGVVGIRTSL